MYHIAGNTYQLVKDHKNAWNFEVFRERYSEVLDRYDYIVGDWGYNQLRLKGFFKETNNKSSKDASITHLHDYLNEYCNFGCAYFIVEKQAVKKGQPLREEDGEGEEAEPEVTITSLPDLTAEKSNDPAAAEIKPRQHYHRAGTEDRLKNAQERWGQFNAGGGNGEGKPKGQDNRTKAGEGRNGNPEQQRIKGHDPKPREGEYRQRDPEGRQRGQDSQRQRDYDSRPKGQDFRGRDQDQRGRGGDQQFQRDGERRGGGARDQQNRGGSQEGKSRQQGQGQNGGQSSEQRGKSHNPNQPHANKNRNQDRNRGRNREQDKEKAEPLA